MMNLMRYFTSLILVLCTSGAHAYQGCDDYWNTEYVSPEGHVGDHVDRLFDIAKLDTPTNKISIIKKMQLEKTPGTNGKFFPTAYVDDDGNGVVTINAQFLRVLCIFVTTTYLDLDEENGNTLDVDSNVYIPSALAAQQCLNAGFHHLDCLELFAAEMAKNGSKYIGSIDPFADGVFILILNTSLYQVLLHEISHILFDHRKK